MTGCFLHPPGLLARPKEFSPSLHQGEHPSPRFPRIAERTCENVLDLIPRNGWPVTVKRGPKPSSVEQVGDGIPRPGPVEKVRLEWEYKEVGMAIEQSS